MMIQSDLESEGARELVVRALDGYELAATLYEAEEARGVVVLSSATAVPRRFYRHFARRLRASGYSCITYDYRGVAGSRPAQLRGFHARMRDWGLLDQSGVVLWAKEELAGDLPLFLVGHSVGGQLAGMVDRPELVAGMVTFSSQLGYWRLQGGEQKAVVFFHTHLTMPVLSRVFGYVPWRHFGGEDLPAGVAREWSRWCRDPAYLLGDDSLPLSRFQEFSAPVLAYSFADDKWGTRRSVDGLMKAYPNVERRHVVPAEAGVGSIGHFGFFREPAAPLWDDVVDWIDSKRS